MFAAQAWPTPTIADLSAPNSGGAGLADSVATAAALAALPLRAFLLLTALLFVLLRQGAAGFGLFFGADGLGHGGDDLVLLRTVCSLSGWDAAQAAQPGPAPSAVTFATRPLVTGPWRWSALAALSPPPLPAPSRQ